MASIKKEASGRWRAFVARKGVRKSAVFDSRQEAKDWSARQEHLILNAEHYASSEPLSGVLDRYAREVSVNKRGRKWEELRLAKIGRDPIGKIAIAELKSKDIAAWRDRRLREVKGSSVAREMTLLSSALKVAQREWGLIGTNPAQQVSKPASPKPRSRVATDEELEALGNAAGDDLRVAMARALHAFRFSAATAMRAGEIVGLTWDRVFLEQRYLHLPVTKNGHERDVPLSLEAVSLLNELPDLEPVFGLRSDQLDALWRKLRDKAGVEGLTFHDARRMGTIKLSKKLEPLELAKATGHRDLSLLLNVYYKANASELAGKLD